MQKFSICILLLFCFMGSTLAQNEQERQKILQQTNVARLQQLSREFGEKQLAEKRRALEVARQKGWQVFMKMPNGTFAELQRIDEEGKPVYYVTQSNLAAAQTTRADRLWTGGTLGLNLNGQGMIVGEWDGGPTRITHQEFGSPTRVINKDGVPFSTHNGNTDHATHVAGTMVAAGVTANAKGMAHQATLWANEWNSDQSEMANQASQGLILSNHSYGYNSSMLSQWQFGFYDNTSAQWDQIAVNAPFYTIVKAAGNDRGAGYNTGAPFGTTGYNLITGSACSKNVLVVAAVNSVTNYTGPSSVTMSSFSSWGPTDDGRIKPDISGMGVGVNSTSSSSNTAYTTMSGTSMASPNVTGTLVLLQQHYKNLNAGNFMRSATLRGLACHTADEAGTSNGPDYRFGWGLLNAERAANVISQRNVTSIIDERTLNNNATYTLNVTALSNSVPLEVTIAWNDPAGTPLPSSTLNSTSPRLVNDLDVRVTHSSTTFFPWVLDPANPANAATNGDNIRDNIEKIVIPNPVAGATYTITVSHKGSLQGGNPQPYSLIVTGIAANPNAVFADFNTSANVVCIGQSITFTDASSKAPSAPAINSWQWNFDVSNIGGASPNTATTQGPHTVTFNQSGTYQISLTVSNGIETDTKTKTIVVRSSNVLPLTEGFESTPVGWTANNTGGSTNWIIANVGQASTRSAAVDLWNNNIGTNALFLNAPGVNLQGYGSVNFAFYVAHRGFGNTPATADYATLELQASSDCGQTFTTIWSKSGQTLATTTPASSTAQFNAPGANDWRLENVSVPAAFIGHNTVLFRFRLTDNYSNWIYVDNINITGIIAPPAAPTTLTATAVSQTQINLSWTDNATNETAYKVERSPNGTSGWVEIAGNLPANTTTYADNGLTANTTYYYRVRANNAGGDSPYSNVANATTLPNPPAAPTTLTATAVSQTQINLSWTDNATNETAYKVERSPNGTSGWVEIAGNLPANTNTYADNGLTANTTYYYRVRANNAGGDSPYSNVANATTLPNPPAAPTTLTATAVSQTQINLSWTDNATNETAYKVERSPNGTSGWVEIAGNLPANTTTYADNGLTANTTYYYRVRASNAGGDSPYSNVANATTLPIPPAAPTTLTATAVSQTQINLSWTDNATNETAYKVERSPNGTSGWVEIAGNLPANTNTYADNGLIANTTYYYRVRANNAGGDSPYSNVANATTLPNPPAAPTTLTATAVSQTQINLSWTDNATNETAYKVERSPDGTSGWVEIAGNLPANTTTYADNGLIANTTYYYRVRANNAGGDSPYSNVANATTQADATTSINIEIDKAISVYPNPSRGEFVVDASKLGFAIQGVVLYNSLGMAVENCAIQGSMLNLNFSHLAKGVYYLEIYTQTGKALKKVVIE